MIVLQAGIVGETLLLWGEAPLEDAPQPGKAQRGRVRGGPQRLPYDAGPADLACALLESLPNVKFSAADAASVIAWLPTTAGTRPIASSPLIAEPPDSTASLELAPWIVTTLPLTAEQALTLLCACVGRETLASGVIIGKSLAFWATALRFAGALVARQQFLPGVAVRDENYRAAWEPVFLGADAERLNRLARAMPAACRALSHDTDTPPQTPALTALTAFIGLTCDALVRSVPIPAAPIGPRPQPTAPKRRRAGASAFDSLHDQWLYALRAPDGRMEGTADELRAFAEQVRE